MKLQTLKGFKDYLPQEALGRKFLVEKIIEVFKKFGFDPLETPTLEYAEVLKGKYGEEEKLIYEFETRGGDKVALKYDQTVPLARVIAQYPDLPKPFKRYQIQPAYRGENTQKGRYREFLQCDADIIGASSPLSDAEILALIYEVYQNLKLDVVIKINDRTLLNLEPKYLAAIDKLNKTGTDGVIKELMDKGLPETKAKKVIETIKNLQMSDNLKNIQSIYEKMGYPKDSLQFDPTMVRGLDYYTGLIVEVVLKSDLNSSSLCGGGRWDKMIGQFTGTDQPAVGFAIGVDRTLEAMEEEQVLEVPQTETKVLVTIFSPNLLDASIKAISFIRKNNIAGEIYLNPDSKLEKQLKYADQKGIPFALIIGPDEVKSNQVVLKDLKSRTQEKLSPDEVLSKLSV